MGSYKLDAEKIMDEAAREHGLQRYVTPALRGRFGYMIGLMNDFGSIREDLYAPAVRQLTDMAAKRLKVAHDWDEHPEILKEDIVQPFFVIGNARAGSTLTQALLTLDEGHRTPVYSVVQHPSPPPGFDAAHDAAARAEQDAYVRFMLEKSPRLLQAHPYLDQGGASEAEDEYVYSLDFHIVYPLWLLKVPNVPVATLPPDPTLALQFHKNMLKQFQWKTPTKRWVGKGVLHQHIPSHLLEVYPDMVGFWIHRKPEEYVASMLEHFDVQYKPFNRELYRFDARAMFERIRGGVNALMANPATNDPRIHHIRFRDLVSDPVSVIAPIYEKNGIPFTRAYEQKLRQRLMDPAQRADRYGKHQYTLQRFGLDAEQVRRIFADYCDRFEL